MSTNGPGLVRPTPRSVAGSTRPGHRDNTPTFRETTWFNRAMTSLPSGPTPWSDSALERSDISGRPDFANAVADRIHGVRTGQMSTVFGLVGPWGGGKTTLLHEIAGKLQDWTVVWFSPWSASDVESVTSEFVASLSEAFPENEIKKRLIKYARYGTPALKLIPIIGDMASDLVAQNLSNLSERPPWHQEFEALSHSIAEQEKKVIVFVDDVDRLDGEELRALLRVVRLLGRFTNVHYLMAYDESTIEASLGPIGARGYMEKIVQYPFEVPPPPKVVRRQWARLIFDTVDPVFPNQNMAYLEERENWVRILADGLPTPRASERLREQVQSLYSLMRAAEIDALEFTMITWLRLSHHAVWEDIRQRPEYYLDLRRDDRELTVAKSRAIEEMVGKGAAGAVIDTLQGLFNPEINSGSIAIRKWRVHKPAYFERYFHIGLSEDDVSELSTMSAVRQLELGDSSSSNVELLTSIVLGSDRERSALALETALDLRSEAGTTSLTLLEYVRDLRAKIDFSHGVDSTAIPAANRWVDREVRLALTSRAVSIDTLVETFGYSTLLASAFAARRETRDDADSVKRTYLGIAEKWLDSRDQESLDDTLALPELKRMTGFLNWVSDLLGEKPFLSVHATSPEALRRIAESYFHYNEWHGNGITYEAAFMNEEFEYAIGGKPSPSLVQAIDAPIDNPDYDTDDLGPKVLTDLQVSDYVVRKLHVLYASPKRPGM